MPAPKKSLRPKLRKKKKMSDVDRAVIEAMNDGRIPGTSYYDSEGNLRSPEQDFNKGGLVGNQSILDKNNDGEISGADFKMMKNGGRVQVKGMAMGGKVKAKGMAMGGKIKSKGYAMGGKVKAKGMAMGGKVKAKGMAMGGKVMSKGYAMGGRVMSKGEAMGGAGFGAARSSGKPIVTY